MHRCGEIIGNRYLVAGVRSGLKRGCMYPLPSPPQKMKYLEGLLHLSTVLKSEDFL